MTTQEILNSRDILLALQIQKAQKKAEKEAVRQKIVIAMQEVITPSSKPTSNMEMAMNLARNAFSVWQGISIGMKVVRSIQTIFRKRR
ncbi:MAG: hypothetical protein IKU79_05220 [Bacteroidaceae bacterium]|nr:hypothetical protein [Bacteroidaceae bacterium]